MLTLKDPTKTYNVKLMNPVKGTSTIVKVRGDQYISDVTEQEGIKLPLSCNAGACVTCTAKLVKGEIYQDHTFLKQKEIDAGFMLICKSYPLSDCTILTHQEDALLDL